VVTLFIISEQFGMKTLKEFQTNWNQQFARKVSVEEEKCSEANLTIVQQLEVRQVGAVR
jgi:hypothetical protein